MSRKVKLMIEFFETLMIITGGVLSVILWAVIIVGGLVELYDQIRGKNKSVTEEVL